MNRRSGPARAGGAALSAGALAVAGLAAWGLWIEPRRLVVRREELRLPGWPDTLDGLRVAVLSDLHAGVPHVGAARLAEVVAAVNAQAPDLVCLVGDYRDAGVLFTRAPEPLAVARALGALRAPLGVVAVLGNHDWKRSGPRMAGALESYGIGVLENDARCVGRGLWIAGLSDYRSRAPSFRAALSQVPAHAPVIALSHDPDVFPRAPARVALTVAGHLHGGQVRIPVVGAARVPSRYGTRYLAGPVEEGGRHLYVTTGVGTSGLPVRFRRPPEVALLALRA